MARTPRSTRSTEPVEHGDPAQAQPTDSAQVPVQPTDAAADAAEAAPTAKPAARRRRARATPIEAEPPARRRIVVTGGAGFVGSAVVHRLAGRGDDVLALVRDPERANRISESGAQLIADDLSSVPRLVELLHGADAVIHAAGSYRVGIRREERGAMWDANVGTTTRILDAAEKAGTPRIVYVSTVNALGNTRQAVVDEAYRRDLSKGFLSWYDETKYGAHEVAEQRIAGGAPIVIVMPSQAYGPGDPSAFGEQLRLANKGALRYRAVDEVGVGLVHVDDLAAGIVAALDRGEIGQSYVLSGPRTTLRDAIGLAAAAADRRPPRLRVPSRLLRLVTPIGGMIGQPNLREILDASAGVTYWASAEKAERELGFRARDLETGFRDTFGGG